jgi:acyl dehydratase
MNLLHVDDFEAGQVFELGQHKFTQNEILTFATEFDPQPFHIDEAAAAQSNYGGLIASGWHTGSVYMRLLVDGLPCRCASMGSPQAWKNCAGSHQSTQATR